jgi:hypothetical protein
MIIPTIGVIAEIAESPVAIHEAGQKCMNILPFWMDFRTPSA